MKTGISPYALLVLLFLTTGGCTGGAGDSTGEQTGSAAETSGSAPTDTGAATTDGEPSHEICDRYIKCVAATVPDGLPSAQEGFGDGGTCWNGGIEAAELCIEACQTGLQQSHTVYPDEPKCDVCLSNADCDVNAGEYCFEGSCGASACGNNVVEAEEICDGQSLCDEDCQGPAACSPVTGAGCSDGQTCSIYIVIEQIDFTLGAGCTEIPATPLGLGEDCTFQTKDVQCGPKLECADASKLTASCKFERCCTTYCDIGVPDQCPAGTVCKFYPKTEPDYDFLDEGLDYVGLCVLP